MVMHFHLEHADWSKSGMGHGGALLAAAWIPRCAKLSELNVSGNDLRETSVKCLFAALEGTGG